MQEFKFLGVDKKPYIGFFEKYASNSGEFIDWITMEAIDCGYQPKGDKFTQNASSSSRIKGKARKKIGGKPNYPSMSKDGADPNNNKNVMVNIKELVKIADQIVKHKGSATVIPDRIIRAGVFAITILNNYRLKINSLENETKIGNIVLESILKEVIVKLQPCLRFPGQSFPSTEVLDYGALAELIGYEGIPWFCVRFRTKVTFNENLSDEKIAVQQLNVFALYSIFIDLNHIHHSILNTWQRYKDGEIDSITASVITNVGFHVATRQCEGFMNKLSPHYKDALSAILLELNYTNEEFLTIVDRGVLEWIFCREFLILEEIRTLDFSEKSFMCPCCSRDQTLHIGSLSTHGDRYVKSSLRFLIVLNQIRLMKSSNIYPYSEDEFTKSILDTLDNKLVPIWLPFALRVFLDIDTLLGDRVVEPYLQLRLISEEVVEQHNRFADTLPHVGNVSLCSWIYKKTLSRMIDGVRDDLILTSQPSSCYNSYDKIHQFSLLKHHPVLSGFTAFIICTASYRFGINTCNSSTEVGLAWQIYMSLRFRGFPLASWPLMDKLNELHLNDLEDEEGLSNREISDLVRTIGKGTDVKNTQERSSKYSLKNPLSIFFIHIDSIRLMFPEFSEDKVSGSPNTHSIMVNRFLRIDPPTSEESCSVNKKIDNINPMRCYSVQKLLEHFANATSSTFEYFLFPFLTLQEQCVRVLLAIKVAQTINPPISRGEDQAGTQQAEKNLALPSTDLQPDSCDVELTPELNLIVKTINSYTENWAYDGINRSHWPVILSNSPGVPHNFLKYWDICYSMCRLQFIHDHKTVNSNESENEKGKGKGKGKEKESENESENENEKGKGKEKESEYGKGKGKGKGKENENENQPTD